MTTFTTHFQPSGILSFDGPDSIKFLQGQTTCNLDELSETKALYGAFCNPKGRIKSTFLLLQIEPEKLLMLVLEDEGSEFPDDHVVCLRQGEDDFTLLPRIPTTKQYAYYTNLPRKLPEAFSVCVLRLSTELSTERVVVWEQACA